MFESLSNRLRDAFRRVAGTARVDEGNVDGALKEVRQALLEADVHYKVVQDLLARVRERALGADVPRGLAPDQLLAKLVQDELAAMMGGAGPRHLAWASLPPTVILLCGLQGTGKTTTAAKLARRLIADGRKVALVAADLRRPAAVEQLQVLGLAVGAEVHTAAPGEDAPALAARAKREALKAGADALIVDTAGRLAIDEELMRELKAVKTAVQPHEVLLVLDAMQGQDALPTATRFHEAVGVDGLVLTKLDGDARGGAALSALAVTGKPIKFLGVGEKTEALEPFHPERLAGRILGMGDVVGLVERVQERVDAEEAARLAKKAAKQGLDLQDLLDQFLQLKKMGSLKELAAMIPGAGAALGEGAMDEGRLKRNIAALQSMTPKERRRPEIIHGERRKRIARGSGTRVEDVNQLLRMHEQMKKMMKKMGQGGRRRGFGLPGLGGLSGLGGPRFPGLPGMVLLLVLPWAVRAGADTVPVASSVAAPAATLAVTPAVASAATPAAPILAAPAVTANATLVATPAGADATTPALTPVATPLAAPTGGAMAGPAVTPVSPVAAGVSVTAAAAPSEAGSASVTASAAAVSPTSAPVSGSVPAASSASPQAAPTAVPAALAPPPPLPAQSSALPEGAPALPGSLPEEDVEAARLLASQASVEAPKPYNPFKLSNFIYGFLSGAALGAAYGLLSNNTGKTNLRNDAAAIYAVGGGLVLGGAAIILGATTPPPLVPPSPRAALPVPGVTLAYRF